MKLKFVIGPVLAALIAGLIFYMNGGVEADTPPSYDAETVYALSGEAVFYIRVLNAEGAVRSTGSGVVISPEGTAATAYHVVKGAERIEVVFPGSGTGLPATVVGFDELTDAAVLALPKRKQAYPAVAVRNETVAFGEKVFAIGYPLKNTPIVTEGIVNNPAAEINGRARMLISAQVVSGMSGGPIIDAQGRLAGIVSGSLRTMNNIHLGIDIADLNAVVQKK